MQALKNLFTKKDSLGHDVSFWQSIKDKFRKLTSSRRSKIIVIFTLVLILIITPIILAGLHAWGIAKIMQSQAQTAETQARGVADQIKSQNFPLAIESIKELSKTVDSMSNTYQTLAIYGSLPFAKEYYQDGKHLLKASKEAVNAGQHTLETISPYIELLGFAGKGTFEGGSAEERVRIILETIEKITPEFDSTKKSLAKIEDELRQVDPSQYPEEIRGVVVRQRLIELKNMLQTTQDSFETFMPVLKQLPSVAGSSQHGPKKYLVIFQNDNELRPSGGFMTAYAIIKIDNGKVLPEKSDDIYELDKKFRKKIEIPEALGRYLTTEKYWNLRDMNTSPDFKISMEQFYQHYKEIPGQPQDIDGIIAIDTHFLVDMMKVLGPTEVPGYGVFSAEISKACDCPQIIHALSEIITRPTPYIRENRKGIIGPLMSALLNKAYSSQDDVWPELINNGFLAIQNRHAQLYFFATEAQQASENALASGRMTPPENDIDFLAIINANLGGAKSNLFIDYEVVQTIEKPTNGVLEKTVEITYKNHRKADNCNLEAGLLCLNSTLRDWTRLYVPQGAELIESQGLKEEPKLYQEEGFSVIDGFFTLEPLGTAKLKFTYTIPYQNSDLYQAQIWKQAGIQNIPFLFDLPSGQDKIEVSRGITDFSSSF